MIEREEVRHVARLARLQLSDAEVDRMAVELAGVLEHIATIEQLDLDDVAPTSHVVGGRKRTARGRAAAVAVARARIASAPQVADDGFAVPSPQA